MASARSSGSDIINLLDSVPKIDTDSTEGHVIPSGKVRGHIRIQDVQFRYPARPEVHVLRGLSFDIEPGSYVALVGASGSGKSTLYVLNAACMFGYSNRFFQHTID